MQNKQQLIMIIFYLLPFINQVFELEPILLLKCGVHSLVSDEIPLLRIDTGEEGVAVEVIQDLCQVNLLQHCVLHGFRVHRGASDDPARLDAVVLR